MRQALRYLARKGAYAVQASGRRCGQSFAIHVGEARPVVLAFIPAAMVAQARSRGWLERDQQGRLRLASAGHQGAAQGAQPPGGGRHRAAQEVRTELPRRARLPAPSRPRMRCRRRRSHGCDGARTRTASRSSRDAQYTAGERLAADYRRAQISRRVTSDWSGVRGLARSRAAARPTPASSSAMRRWRRASVSSARIAAVGSELAGILIDVCCHETGLEAAERAEGWPQRAAKVVLQLALTSLARHYGLIAPERSPFARLRHWGDEDYRPGLDAWRMRCYPISRMQLRPAPRPVSAGRVRP